MRLKEGQDMDIPSRFVAVATAQRFSDGDALQGFLAARLGQDFPGWFNAKVARRDHWAERAIPPAGAAGFAALWAAFLPLRPASLLEVLAYTSIFINETGGLFQPIAEKMGAKGHPGLAYLFDAIPGLKRPYNAGPGNLTAGQLFRDPDFNKAHGTKALGAKLANTRDPVWDGTAYPQGSVPTDNDPALAGYVMEADFCKFRGRGLIQTTWRAGYRPLVGFIQGYAGAQPVVAEYRKRWAGLSADAACTISSNADWDRLFQQSDFLVPLQALLLHAKAAGYLPLCTEAAVVNGAGPGSVFNMGKRISGGEDYAMLFKARLAQLASTMGPP
jgi:hypothetical protein